VEKEIIMTYPQTATKPEDPIHVGLPQLVFCALLSCTLWASLKRYRTTSSVALHSIVLRCSSSHLSHMLTLHCSTAQCSLT